MAPFCLLVSFKSWPFNFKIYHTTHYAWHYFLEFCNQYCITHICLAMGDTAQSTVFLVFCKKTSMAGTCTFIFQCLSCSIRLPFSGISSQVSNRDPWFSILPSCLNYRQQSCTSKYHCETMLM